MTNRHDQAARELSALVRADMEVSGAKTLDELQAAANASIRSLVKGSSAAVSRDVDDPELIVVTLTFPQER